MGKFLKKSFAKKGWFSVFFIILLLSGQTAYSSECYVKSGKVAVGVGGAGKVNILAGAVLKPCKGSAIDAVICYENKLEQQICKRQSGVFSLTASTNERSSKSLFESIYSIYNPSKNGHYGGKRLKDSRALPGFPAGELLLPSSSLKFSTDTASRSSMMKFHLYKKDINKLIFSSNKAGRTVVIPASKLYFGGKFKWVAQLDGEKFSGGFTVALREDQKEFEDELSNLLAKSDSSESTGHLLRAVLAKDYGYTFDMHQSLEAARSTIKQGW